MRLTLLGTGTPAPSLERQSSGYLIEVAGEALLFDHGPGAHHRLLESGRRATDITHVLFSHLHYDHCMDYARLVLQRWDQGAGRIPELEVYGPPPIARMTALLFGEDGVYGPDLAARIGHESSLDVFRQRGGTLPRRRPTPRVTEVRAGSVVNGRAWAITVGRAAHVQPYLECLAFRLDSDDGSVCYSGDGSPTDALVELARECDVLVQMNHFFSGREPSAASRAACGHHLGNADLARQAGVKTLVLTHIPPDLDAPDTRERILSDVRQVFDGRVVWGEDLLELTVERS
jgi:ribonuclease BN (tRNA processing enzyme)